MKYYIYDNDNGVMVCATDNRKEAFPAILNHLIAADGSEVPDPIMWPVDGPARPEDLMPATKHRHDDAWSVIRQAQAAYEQIAEYIPSL